MKDPLSEANRHRIVGVKAGFILGVSAAANLLEDEGYPAIARRLTDALRINEINPMSSPWAEEFVNKLVGTP